jgi:hypothetical protein
VERYLESISAVAEALAQKRYLSGDEVVAIMQAVGCKPQSNVDLEFIATEGS